MSENQTHLNTKELLLPSLYTVVIREQNGEDDDILSNESTASDLTNIDMFLASIIIETNLPFAKGKRLTYRDVPKMALADKYFILISSRIHTIGNIITFPYDWGSNLGTFTYEEDLNNFIWDYNKELPKEGDNDYCEFRIKPYSKNPYEAHEFILSTGKRLKFNFGNGESEKYMIKLSPDKRSQNSELRARNLELYVEVDQKFIRVESFSTFTKREMIEINRIVKEIDPPLTILSELKHPSTGDKAYVSPVQHKDFLFPDVI